MGHTSLAAVPTMLTTLSVAWLGCRVRRRVSNFLRSLYRIYLLHYNVMKELASSLSHGLRLIKHLRKKEEKSNTNTEILDNPCGGISYCDWTGNSDCYGTFKESKLCHI